MSTFHTFHVDYFFVVVMLVLLFLLSDLIWLCIRDPFPADRHVAITLKRKCCSCAAVQLKVNYENVTASVQ